MAKIPESKEYIVDAALDMSRRYWERDNTIGEIEDLFNRLGIKTSEENVRAVARYVSLAESRRSTHDHNTYGPGSVGGV